MKTGDLYRHYKGGIYRFLFIGMHTETGEEFVVYQSTTGEPRNWLRPVNMFFDDVSINGIQTKRFKLFSSKHDK